MSRCSEQTAARPSEAPRVDNRLSLKPGSSPVLPRLGVRVPPGGVGEGGGEGGADLSFIYFKSLRSLTDFGTELHLKR